MGLTFGTQVFYGFRRCFGDLAAFGILAVEYAKRVRGESFATGITQLVAVSIKIIY